jgi:DNA-binding transcriptional MerR regulator
MALLSISAVARQAGLRASAIRYYEQVGVLPPAARVSGQRRYGAATLHRLAVIRHAQEAGIRLAEIRELFRDFREDAWKSIAQRRIPELDAQIAHLRAARDRLLKLQENCACETVEQCGACTSAASPPATC